MSSLAPFTAQHWLVFGSLLKSLHGNFLLSIFLRGAAALVALGANVVLARVLGVDEYGRYMTLYSAAIVLGSLAVRGTDQLLTRELSAGAASQSGWRHELGSWCRKRVAVGVGVAAIIYLAWSFFASKPGSGWGRWLADPAALILIALFSLCAMFAGALNGYGASQRSQSLVPLINNGVVLLVVGGLWFGAIRSISGSMVLWLQTSGYLLACVLGWYWLSRLMHRESASDATVTERITSNTGSSGWVSASRGFFFIAIGAVVTNRLDVVLVSMLAGSRSAGVYVAGARLAQVALLVAMSVNIVLSPRISRVWYTGSRVGIRHLLRGGFLFTVAVSVLEVLIAVLFGSDIVKVFGGSYSGSAPVFILIVAAYAFWTLAAPGYALLGMAGAEKMLAALSWLVAIVNVVALLILVPLYGAFGGGCAMIAGYVVVLPFLVGAVMRKLRSPTQAG